MARLKIKDWVSVKAWPQPLVRVARTLPLLGTGMALRLLYECPLSAAVEPWRPPARLMCRCVARARMAAPLARAEAGFLPPLARGRLLSHARTEKLPLPAAARLRNAARRLDHSAGSGFHVSPSGVEFDERVLALGSGVELRGAAAVRFPRELPIDESNPAACFGLEVQRLTVKAAW